MSVDSIDLSAGMVVTHPEYWSCDPNPAKLYSTSEQSVVYECLTVERVE